MTQVPPPDPTVSPVPGPPETPGLRDDAGRQRLVREERGEAVFATYRMEGTTLVIRHVEAAPPLRGTGAADRLMRAIAGKARAEGLHILPLCGYAAAWLRRHREFSDLVAR